MKYKLIFSLAFLFFAFFGCGGDGNGDSNPVGIGGLGDGGGNGGGGGGNTGNVSIQVNAIQDPNDQSTVIFQFTPSESITVSSVNVSISGSQYSETIQADGTTVYSPQDGFVITSPIAQSGQYPGIQSGQTWTFTIAGKVGSANGADYTATANYTVQ